MKRTHQRRVEQGIALLTTLLLLLMLSALAVGLMYISSTDTQINANFRGEQSAYFAARAGFEELRDRMAIYNANTIASSLPTSLPTTGNSATQVIYLVNDGAQSGSVSPWDNSNAYMDTELCHDGYTGLGLTALSSDVPCLSVPSGSYAKITSTLPLNGTSGAVPFKWARLTLKQANSIAGYPVNTGNSSATTMVCWNGSYEVLLPSTVATCSAMPNPSNPVYLITALAVTKTGGRKMVQGELALQPAAPFGYGLFATGQGCGAVTLSGTGYTDSYTSANGGTWATTHTNTGGDVGANGNVTGNGNVSVGGSVGSSQYNPNIGACPGSAFTTIGGAGMVNNPANVVQKINPVTIPTPIIPSTTGPAKSNPGTLSPGNYGDITIKQGTTTLSPGVYNVNSLNISANGQLTVTGPVTINVQGNGTSSPIDLEGQGVVNQTNLASDLQINYAGTGTVTITGGAQMYAVVLAPNASVNIKGGSDVYGAIVGAQISNSGNPDFHYDRNLKLPSPSNSYYSLLSFRELYY